jgi:hypothetical protein
MRWRGTPAPGAVVASRTAHFPGGGHALAQQAPDDDLPVGPHPPHRGVEAVRPAHVEHLRQPGAPDNRIGVGAPASHGRPARREIRSILAVAGVLSSQVCNRAVRPAGWVASILARELLGTRSIGAQFGASDAPRYCPDATCSHDKSYTGSVGVRFGSSVRAWGVSGRDAVGHLGRGEIGRIA